MKIFLLLFKEKFKNLFRNKKIHFFLVFFSIFLLVVLFAPLFQFQLFNQIKNNDFLKNSGSYEYKITLPVENLIQNEEKFLEENFLSYKKELDYIYSPSFVHFDNKNKKIYFIKKISNSKNFNKVVNVEESKTFTGILKDDQIILNTKFIDLNKEFKVNGKFELGDKEYEVLFKGERISDYSIGFKNSLANIAFFDLHNEKEYFKNIINVLVNRKQYDYLLNYFDQNKKQNKHIFIKFKKNINEYRKKDILKKLKEDFSEKWNKSLIKVISFYKDSESGLKIKINNLFDIFIIIFFVFLLFVILLLFLKFNKIEFQQKQKQIFNLIVNGFNYKKFVFFNTIYNFFIIFLTTLLGIFIGVFVVNFFYSVNKDSSLLFLKNNYFSSSVFFIIFLLFIPFFVSFFSFIFQIYYFNKNFIKFRKKKIETTEYFFLFLKKWILLYLQKTNLFLLILFKNIKKKIFWFFLLLLTIILFFLLFFIKISFNNFIENKNFIGNDIKSISKIDSIDLIENKKIYKTTKFIEKNSKENEFQVLDFKNISNNFKILLNLKNFNSSCLNEWINYKINGTKFKSYKCSDGFFIKLNVKDLPEKEIKKKLIKLGIKSIFINTAVYDLKIDYPALFLKSNVVNIQDDNFEETKESYTLFLSNEHEWSKFFPDLKKSLDLQDIEIKDNKFYLKNKSSENEYILLPESQKSNYKKGDKIILKFYVGEKTLNKSKEIFESKFDGKIDEWEFVVAGFIPNKLINQPISFVNYDFFNKNNIIKKSEKVYNFLLSKENENYLKRNLIIDINPEKTDLNNFDKVNILNLESIVLSSIKKMNFKHFVIYDWYLFFILIVISIILLFVFFMISDSQARNNIFLFKKLNILGIKIFKLFLMQIVCYFIYVVTFSFVGFLISYLIFLQFSKIFLNLGINFNIYNFWQYFGYFFLIIFLILIKDIIIQYFSLFYKKKIIF